MSSLFSGQARYEHLHRQSLILSEICPSKRKDALVRCADTLLGSSEGGALAHVWGGYRCRWRFCPLCLALDAGVRMRTLAHAMVNLQADTGCEYIFLTLTVANMPNLQQGIVRITGAWSKFQKSNAFSRVAVYGWYRAIEVTHGPAGYHPHIHAIIAVDKSYFYRNNKHYLRTCDWAELWRRALGVDYTPVCDVRAVYNRDRKLRGGYRAAVEGAKYAVKSVEYIRNPEILNEYDIALSGARLTAYGGKLREYAKIANQKESVRYSPEDTITFYWDKNCYNIKSIEIDCEWSQ